MPGIFKGVKVFFPCNKPKEVQKMVTGGGGEVMKSAGPATHYVVEWGKQERKFTWPTGGQVVVKGEWLRQCITEDKKLDVEPYLVAQDEGSPVVVSSRKRKLETAVAIEAIPPPMKAVHENPVVQFWTTVTDEKWVAKELMRVGLKGFPLRKLREHHFATLDKLLDQFDFTANEQVAALYAKILPGRALLHTEASLLSRRRDLAAVKWLKKCLNCMSRCRKPADAPVLSNIIATPPLDDVPFKIFKAKMRTQTEPPNKPNFETLPYSDSPIRKPHGAGNPVVAGVEGKELLWRPDVLDVLEIRGEGIWDKYQETVPGGVSSLGWVVLRPYEVFHALCYGLQPSEVIYSSLVAALEAELYMSRRLYLLLVSMKPLVESDAPRLVLTLHKDLLVLQESEIASESVKSATQKSRLTHVASLLATASHQATSDDPLPIEIDTAPPTIRASKVASLPHYVYDIRIQSEAA